MKNKVIILLIASSSALLPMEAPKLEKRGSRLENAAHLQAYEQQHNQQLKEDQDTVIVTNLMTSLIGSLNQPEVTEHHLNILKKYEALKAFAEHSVVHKQWENKRLFCLALTEVEKTTMQEAWAKKKIDSGSRIIANVKDLKETYIRALANHRATEEFDLFIANRILAESQHKHGHRKGSDIDARLLERLDELLKKRDKKEKKHHKTPRE